MNLLFPPDPLSQKKKMKNNLYSHYQTKTSVVASLVTYTSFKLVMNKIKLTETVLFVVHNHFSFGQNKSSNHRVRCENIPFLRSVFTHFNARLSLLVF